jgi:hypothetical protein
MHRSLGADSDEIITIITATTASDGNQHQQIFAMPLRRGAMRLGELKACGNVARVRPRR